MGWAVSVRMRFDLGCPVAELEGGQAIQRIGSAWPITRLIEGERSPQGALQRVDLLMHRLHAQVRDRRGSGS